MHFSPILLELQLTLNYRNETSNLTWDFTSHNGEHPNIFERAFFSFNRLTHVWKVFASGTALLRGVMNLRKKLLESFVITDLFFLNTGNPQCSPVQTKMATKKGSKTNHKETKSNTTAQVLPLPNCLVCSVAPCALLICFILYFPANCLKTFCEKYDVFKGCYSLGFGSKH